MSVSDLVSIINQLLPEPHAGLLAGILFGTKATLSKSLYQDLITSGTLHIVALSGMNITIIASLVSLTLLRFVSRRIASLLTILLIIGFVWFVGLSPSVIRAAIMGCISLLAVIFGKQQWALFSWALAVGIMLLINFGWLGDISFQLSALATLGIILFGNKEYTQKARVSILKSTEAPYNITLWVLGLLFGNGASLSEEGEAARGYKQTIRASLKNILPLLNQLLKFLWLFIKDDLRITLAAQVFTIPIIIFQFHRISLVSPLSNVLIGWMIAPITILGMFAAGIGYVWLPLGQVVAWFSWVLLEYLVLVVSLTSKFPFASLAW